MDTRPSQGHSSVCSGSQKSCSFLEVPGWQEALNTRQGKAPKVDATAWNSSLATDKNSGSPVLSPVCVKGQSSPECYQPHSHGPRHLRRAPDGTRDHRCPMPPLPVLSSSPSAHSRWRFSLFITGLGSNSWLVRVKHAFSPI